MGVGANPIRYEAIPTPWYALITDRTDPGLCVTSRTELQCRSILALWTQLGDFVATIHFGVVSLLSVKGILSTPYIDSCIRHLYHLRGKIQPVQSRSVHIHTAKPIYRYPRHDEWSRLAATVLDTKLPRDETALFVLLARQVDIPPYIRLFAKVR